MAASVTPATAVVLFSGGLDSTTVLHMARSEGFEVVALSFDYGQRHRIELEIARRAAAKFGVREFVVARVDPALFQTGDSGGVATALVGSSVAVPRSSEPLPAVPPAAGDIPVTYVPARNILFLSHALAVAESRGARDVFIGVNALDYSGYPDCRPEFIAAFETMARLGMKTGTEGQGVRIRAPLVKMTKAEIIAAGLKLGVDYAHSWSCYSPLPGERPCLECESCRLRARGFERAGVADPLLRD